MPILKKTTFLKYKNINNTNQDPIAIGLKNLASIIIVNKL